MHPLIQNLLKELRNQISHFSNLLFKISINLCGNLRNSILNTFIRFYMKIFQYEPTINIIYFLTTTHINEKHRNFSTFHFKQYTFFGVKEQGKPQFVCFGPLLAYGHERDVNRGRLAIQNPPYILHGRDIVKKIKLVGMVGTGKIIKHSQKH